MDQSLRLYVQVQFSGDGVRRRRNTYLDTNSLHLGRPLTSQSTSPWSRRLLGQNASPAATLLVPERRGRRRRRTESGVRSPTAVVGVRSAVYGRREGCHVVRPVGRCDGRGDGVVQPRRETVYAQ